MTAEARNWFGSSATSEIRSDNGVVLQNEAGGLIEREEPSLGELNPLLHFPELERRESVDALRQIILQKIEKNGGMMPQRLESALVCTIRESGPKPEFRFIARFEIGQPTSEDQMALLEGLVRDTYKVAVRTRTSSDGKDIELESYPPINPGERGKSKTAGWYMGPNLTSTDSLHTGLFVFKDLGEVNKDNFLKQDTSSETKYIVEVREAPMYQTDLVEFITQVSSVLGNSRILPRDELLYEVYYDLIRLGLKKVNRQSIYGIEDKVAQIRRGLLTPLANPQLSRGLGQQPESVLMVGVPGTGKTLAVEQLLQEETGVFILPIDPLELKKELVENKDKQKLLPRIAEVARRTGRRVVLHIDDIENMVGADESTHSTLRGLMEGVSNTKFFIIASTNDPEKIDSALLQPQRFGIRIHFGLQEEEARYEILKIHAQQASRNLKVPLFKSPEERDDLLRGLARLTAYYTPRYLAEIANVAKSYLLARVARDKGRMGLTEEDLAGYAYRIEDFDLAYQYVQSTYDRDGTEKRDDELRRSVERANKGRMGLTADRQDSDHSRFFDQLYRLYPDSSPQGN